MSTARPNPIRLELSITVFESDPITADDVRDNVESYAASKVQCRKHKKPLASVAVQMVPGKATVDCTPCCVRPAAALKAALKKLKSVVDDRVVKRAPEGHHFIRAEATINSVLAPPPPVMFGSHGVRSVPPAVAAKYAEAGRLYSVTRVDGAIVDVSSPGSFEEELRKKGITSWPQPCNEENIALYTKPVTDRAVALALKEGKPMSSYAVSYDWDQNVVRILPSPELRALFVEAGDCPTLVDEIDENGRDTLLIFIFANNRYDRTVRMTQRGFFAGTAGSA